jgi:hypothetical protein
MRHRRRMRLSIRLEACLPMSPESPSPEGLVPEGMARREAQVRNGVRESFWDSRRAPRGAPHAHCCACSFADVLSAPGPAFQCAVPPWPRKPAARRILA